MDKFPASIPRRMFWSSSVGTFQCPQCKGPLENERHSYFFVISTSGGSGEFITGTDGGFFCSRCPIVVLDVEKFTELAKISVGEPGEEFNFLVVGLVDLDAIPLDKRDVPIGAEDNLVPLVEFINIAKLAMNPRERAKQRTKKRRQEKKKKSH